MSSSVIATALHLDINQTAGSGGHLNDLIVWENRCMHATVCAVCRPAKMGRRRGEIRSVHRSILMEQICLYDSRSHLPDNKDHVKLNFKVYFYFSSGIYVLTNTWEDANSHPRSRHDRHPWCTDGHSPRAWTRRSRLVTLNVFVVLCCDMLCYAGMAFLISFQIVNTLQRKPFRTTSGIVPLLLSCGCR